MKLSRTPLNLKSFWPLLVIIAALVFVVWRTSPANLTILPYKLLVVCLAIYLDHRYGERAFSKVTDWIETVFVGTSFSEPVAKGLAAIALSLLAIARALAFIGIVVGFSTGL